MWLAMLEANYSLKKKKLFVPCVKKKSVNVILVSRLFRKITESLLKLIRKYILHYGIKGHLRSTITHYYYADVASI
jgi:hypothetical protein